MTETAYLKLTIVAVGKNDFIYCTVDRNIIFDFIEKNRKY